MSNSLPAVIVVFACSALLPAQSADEILSKHAAAMGGLERWKSIRTVRVETRVDTSDPSKTFKFVIMRKRPGRFRFEETTKVNGLELPVTQGCDGKEGWIRTGAGPATKVDFPFCAQVADIGGEVLRKRVGEEVELVARENLQGVDVYHFRLTHQGRTPAHFYINAQTFLLDRSVSEDKEQHRVEMFSDYRRVNGVMVPFCDDMRWWPVSPERPHSGPSLDESATRQAGHQKQIVEKIEFNLQLDDALFKMPGEPAKGARR